MAGSSDAVAQLRSGAEQIIPAGGLAEKLATGRPLRVKFGVDPSRPDLHLGHAVPLRKLRRFQDAGHVAVLIIGDFTGRVGDPSGRPETRPLLAAEEVDANAETYLAQAGTVLDMERAEVRRNSEWLASMGMDDVLRLTSTATVAQMLERDDFHDRYRAGRPISVVEFLYPLLQGMDSVAIEADVELGGTDQTFNLLMGRTLQREHGQEPQIVMTVPLLEGIDGERKMSKSFDNAIALADPPDEMFGRLMRIPDALIGKYLRLTTDLPPAEVDRIEAGLADGSLHPAHEKRRLAREVVDLYHGEGAGREAEGRFDRVFRSREVPRDVAQHRLAEDWAGEDGRYWLPRVLSGVGFASSKGEARRLIQQGAVRLDGEVVTDPEAEFERDALIGRVLQVGRRRFARLESPS
jgi:tyrosyl-tRNA synthetase